MNEMKYMLYIQKWNNMTIKELEKERTILFDKIKSLPKESKTVRENLKDIMAMLDKILIEKSV